MKYLQSMMLLGVGAALAFAQGRGPTPSPETQQATQLDLQGKSAEARVIWQKQIDQAPTPAARAAAERNMAMSWAFDANCAQTAAYEQKVIAYWKTQEQAAPANAFYQQGEMADEAARVCIDLGDLDQAAALYKQGHDLGLREPNISAGRRDLWEYRYQHALARLAARRGDRAQAKLQVAAARATLDKMKTDDPKLYAQQTEFFPYLTGYVAYYAGDYKTALADFQKDTRHDPFITAMIGMTWEQLGDSDKANAAYDAASQTQAHNPPAAFAHRANRNISH